MTKKLPKKKPTTKPERKKPTISRRIPELSRGTYKARNDDGSVTVAELPPQSSNTSTKERPRRFMQARAKRGSGEQLGSMFTMRASSGEVLAWHRMAALVHRNLAAVIRELLNREVLRVNAELEKGTAPATLATRELPHMGRQK
jgi:hypothetical protein